MDNLRCYNLAIAWSWEYDDEFVNILNKQAESYNLSVLNITSENVEDVFNEYKKKKIFFDFILDRASDEDELFQPFARYINKLFVSGQDKFTRPINPLDLQLFAADKATMHLEFISHGIDVPYTIIISSYNHKKEPELSLTELAKLGRPFIIKPANTTGGGIGVVTGAETLKEVLMARQFHKNDKYLLQETIKPTIIADKRAWFRVFYVFGKIIPCWWDDITHLYESVSQEDEVTFGLSKLSSLTQKIYSICKLDFFSTELVITEDSKCVAVDYVNEMCDMRLQSLHYDGVPDDVVFSISEAIVSFIKNNIS